MLLIMRRHIIGTLSTVLLAALLAACSDSSTPEHSAPAAGDSAAAVPRTDSAPAVPRSPEMVAGPSFEESVVHDYAKLAASAPKRVTDSILTANRKDPRKFEAAMTKYFHDRDAKVRQQIADVYNISVDSLNRIIERQNSRSASSGR